MRYCAALGCRESPVAKCLRVSKIAASVGNAGPPSNGLQLGCAWLRTSLVEAECESGSEESTCGRHVVRTDRDGGG